MIAEIALSLADADDLIHASMPADPCPRPHPPAAAPAPTAVAVAIPAAAAAATAAGGIGELPGASHAIAWGGWT